MTYQGISDQLSEKGSYKLGNLMAHGWSVAKTLKDEQDRLSVVLTRGDNVLMLSTDDSKYNCTIYRLKECI